MGSSRLFVDGQLVIDNGYEKQQTYGGTFYGAGTIEEKGVCNVTAGEKYHIEIEFTNYKNPGKTAEVAIKRGQPSLMTAALRLGGTMKIQDEERALQDAVDLVGSCDAAICFTGSDLGWEGEGADRTQFLLPGRTNELVERLLAVKPETIICNQTVRIRFARFIVNTHAEFLVPFRRRAMQCQQGSAFAMPWISEATTLLQSWFGGNETGNAIADVVFGEVNPSGRMPLSFPYQIEDCTGFLNWQAENGKVYYGEGGSAARGRKSQGSKLTRDIWPGLFVGYRGYEATKRDTMFAFGEGQSYTSFGESTRIASRKCVAYLDVSRLRSVQNGPTLRLTLMPLIAPKTLPPPSN
jgi:beta-glucosidase